MRVALYSNSTSSCQSGTALLKSFTNPRYRHDFCRFHTPCGRGSLERSCRSGVHLMESNLTSGPAMLDWKWIFKANPTSGGVTASTEMLAAKRHAGVHTPVIVGKMIIANQQMAYAA